MIIFPKLTRQRAAFHMLGTGQLGYASQGHYAVGTITRATLWDGAEAQRGYIF